MIYDFILNLISGLLYIMRTLFNAIPIPESWITAIETVFTLLYSVNLIIPVSVFFEAVMWYISFEIALFTIRQAFNIINWLRGAGKGLDI